jgi:hypothetical protein
MRAVVIGLVGAILVPGAVEAAARSCRVSKAVLKLEPYGPRDFPWGALAIHPEWAKREFRIVSAGSNVVLKPHPAGDLRPSGYDVFTMKSEGSVIRAARSLVFGSPPVWGTSWTGGRREVGILTKPITRIGGHLANYASSGHLPSFIVDGPLTGYSLALARCAR